MIKVLTVAILLLSATNCAHSEETLSELTEKVSVAVANADRRMAREVCDSITFSNLTGEHAWEFARLKVLALSLLGEYENAETVMRTMLDVSDQKSSALIAIALLNRLQGDDWEAPMNRAFELLRSSNVSDLSQQDATNLLYLQSLLGSTPERAESDALQQRVEDFAPGLSEFYDNMTTEELLVNPPIMFVSSYVIPEGPDQGGDRWWE